MDGIRAMVDRVIAQAHLPCLGVGSLSEFGDTHADLADLRERLGTPLRQAVIRTIQTAQTQGDIDPDLDAAQTAAFLMANVAGIRLAARGGADETELQSLGRLALRALR
jgi:hypothetical protein